MSTEWIECPAAGDDGDVDLIGLDAALRDLEQHDARMAELVTQRYFGGLTMEQAAENLNISLATANREWRMAKAWLRNRMAEA